MITNASTIIAALAGAGAAFFVSLQVLHMKRSREVDTFLRLIEVANTEEFRRASQWVKSEITSKTTYEQSGQKEYWANTSLIINYFEMVGNLVNRRYISRDLIYDQMGSWIIGMWSKLHIIIAAHRAAKESPQYAENFELLASGYDSWALRHSPKLEQRRRSSSEILQKFYTYAKKKKNS